jgi:hypothetical protein
MREYQRKTDRGPSITKGKRRGVHKLEVLERRQHVFRLRVTGASYSRIAASMRQDPAWQGRLPKNYCDRYVYDDVMAEVQRRQHELTIDVNMVRQQELDLLDSMQLAIIGRALGTPANLAAGIPAQPLDLQAQQQVLRIMERRAKLIPGLSAPLPIAPTTPDGAEPYQGNGGPNGTFFAELAVLFREHGPDHITTATDNDDSTTQEDDHAEDD